MTRHTGQFGMVDGQKALRNWAITPTLTTNKVVHSGTVFGSTRTNGVRDFTGSFSAYGAKPSFLPGQYYDFVGLRAPDADNDIANGDLYEGNILVTSVVITFNFATNEAISHVVNFGGNGPLTYDTGTLTVHDAVREARKTPCAGKIVTFVPGSPGVETIIPHVSTATLTLTRDAVTAVDSGEIDGSGKCVTMRKPNEAYDWNLAITTNEGNRNTLLADGTDHIFRIYTDGTEFYELQWGKIETVNGLTVNRESTAVLSQTYAINMNGVVTTALGSIKLPGGDVFWPEA